MRLDQRVQPDAGDLRLCISLCRPGPLGIGCKKTPIRYDLAFIRQHQINYLRSANRFTSGEIEDILAPVAILKNFVWDQEAANHSDSPVPVLIDFTPYLEYYYFRQPEPLIAHPERLSQVNRFVQRLDNCDTTCREMIRSLALE